MGLARRLGPNLTFGQKNLCKKKFIVNTLKIYIKKTSYFNFIFTRLFTNMSTVQHSMYKDHDVAV